MVHWGASSWIYHQLTMHWGSHDGKLRSHVSFDGNVVDKQKGETSQHKASNVNSRHSCRAATHTLFLLPLPSTLTHQPTCSSPLLPPHFPPHFLTNSTSSLLPASQPLSPLPTHGFCQSIYEDKPQRPCQPQLTEPHTQTHTSAASQIIKNESPEKTFDYT